VVDVANVMGARPDGWWRDRAGAAKRLRQQIAELAARGITAEHLPPDLLTPADWAQTPANQVFHPNWVLVVEGQARAATPPAAQADDDSPLVRVVCAPAAGDDEIVRQAAMWSVHQPCLVVTADRELRRRCAAVGARTVGPGWLLNLL